MPEMRDNKGKRRMSLVPIEPLEDTIDIFEFGGAKYEPFNWQKAENITNFMDSAYRHMMAISKGEMVDKESGKDHFAHVATNMWMASWVVKNKMQNNKDTKNE